MRYRYLIIDDYMNVTGTNDEMTARAAFLSGESTVVDAQGLLFVESDDDEGIIDVEEIPDHAAGG